MLPSVGTLGRALSTCGSGGPPPAAVPSSLAQCPALASEESHSVPRNPGLSSTLSPQELNLVLLGRGPGRPPVSTHLCWARSAGGHITQEEFQGPRLRGSAQHTLHLSSSSPTHPQAPHPRPQGAHDSQSTELLDKQDRSDHNAAFPSNARP